MDYQKLAEEAVLRSGLSKARAKEIASNVAQRILEEESKIKTKKIKKEVVFESKDIIEPENTYKK